MDNNLFKMEIFRPDRIMYTGEASMVELNTTEGELGVYKNHIPLTCIVSPGIVKIYEDGGEVKRLAVHRGFVQILQDSVTIMAEIAEWGKDIDLERAKSAKERALKALKETKSDEEEARFKAKLKRAEVRIELAEMK